MTNNNELVAAAFFRHLIAGLEAEKIIDKACGDGTVKRLAAEIYEVFEEQSALQKVCNE